MSTDIEQFIGKHEGISDKDIIAAANSLKCDPNVVRTVLNVESSGSGFFSNGAPKILYEAHLFGRLTNGAYNKSHPAISAPNWDTARKYYKGGIKEYDRLIQAISLNRSAALQSCSWGLFQILGSNFKASGFANVEDYVAANMASEGKQLDCFVNFVKANHLDDELQNKAWANFAKAYNGPSYKTNQYDVKMAKTFTLMVQKHKNSDEDYKDTPAATTGIVSSGKLSPRDAFAVLQTALNLHGANPKLIVDGYPGYKTTQAIKDFQQKMKLTVDGIAGPNTYKALGL
jgi:hypothetical protein